MGSAYYVWTLQNAKESHVRLRTTALTVASVYTVCRFIAWLIQYSFRMEYMPFPVIFTILLGHAADMLLVYFSMHFMEHLCTSSLRKVELYGIGKVWSWIAAVGAFFSIGTVLIAAFGNTNTMGYTANILLAICGAAGYIMLLCKNRTGLYMILSASVLVLGSQFIDHLTQLFYGYGHFAALFFSSVLGAVNPLFAWLAVRAADKRDMISSDTATSTSVIQDVSGFQKFAAIFNIVIGSLLIIPIVGNVTSWPEPGYIATLVSLSAIFLIFGIMATAAQRSDTKPYPSWLNVITIVLFSFGTLSIAITLVGVIASVLD